jgi:hypothetical protein
MPANGPFVLNGWSLRQRHRHAPPLVRCGLDRLHQGMAPDCCGKVRLYAPTAANGLSKTLIHARYVGGLTRRHTRWHGGEPLRDRQGLQGALAPLRSFQADRVDLGTQAGRCATRVPSRP